ncbi:MAG TPA: 1,6-anhydro-N-acetylmuramyl-L-alanine amidase AmpD [Steroidobacteraceae bacterium]|nr:1,6-anhydro-N-acetylmuramyl-L-alanine amidase AmpD [Steroidobacteraceae bacterium]
MDVGRGLISPARQVASPNQDARPPGASIDLVVVHGISLPPGEFGGPWVDRLFTNTLPPDVHPFFATIAGLKVSAHLYIRRDGELVQFVPFHARAWHAGASVWRHRLACNDFSVGIELEGDDAVPYSAAQYRRLAEAIVALRRAYATLAPDAITGHSDIAPGRKTDPGPLFDWPRLHAGLAAAGAGAPA